MFCCTAICAKTVAWGAGEDVLSSCSFRKLSSFSGSFQIHVCTNIRLCKIAQIHVFGCDELIEAWIKKPTVKDGGLCFYFLSIQKCIGLLCTWLRLSCYRPTYHLNNSIFYYNTYQLKLLGRWQLLFCLFLWFMWKTRPQSQQATILPPAGGCRGVCGCLWNNLEPKSPSVFP